MTGTTPLQTNTFIASANISEARFITPAGAHAGAATDIVAGVSRYAADSGYDISVDDGGILTVECGGDITQYAQVTSGANGKAAAIGTAAGYVLGIALEAGADTQKIRILSRNYYKPTTT